MYNIEKHKSIRKDGSRCPLCYLEEFILLGDMELCGEKSPILFVEISKRTIFVELSLYEYRDTLLNDNTFLRYLLHSVAHKMAFLAQSEVSYSSQEEKLLHYLKYDCPDQQIRGGVEAVSIHLRCSRPRGIWSTLRFARCSISIQVLNAFQKTSSSFLVLFNCPNVIDKNPSGSSLSMVC